MQVVSSLSQCFDEILELFQPCCIFVFLLDFRTVPIVLYFFVFLLDFRTVPTVLYFLLFISLLRQERGYLCIIFRRGISIFRRGISILSLCLWFSLLDVDTVPTVCYWLCHFLDYFWFGCNRTRQKLKWGSIFAL